METIPVTSGSTNFDSTKAQTSEFSAAYPPTSMLQQRQSTSKTQTSNSAHREAFEAMYHVLPAHNYPTFQCTKSSVFELASVARIYGCQHVVKPQLENRLNAHRIETLDFCAQDPLAMLGFAIDVKLGWIFKEAAANLLGRHNGEYNKPHPKHEELNIADLFDAKRAQKHSKLRDCDFELLCILYPVTGPGCEHIAHAAMSFYRQWLIKSLRDRKWSPMKMGYAKPYRAIANGSDWVKEFENQRLIRDYLNETKAILDPVSVISGVQKVFVRASEIAKPILKDVTLRQRLHTPESHELLFMGIEDEELPWTKK